ncbi:hypothetical protein PoB_006264000 [Plakobranchus ocellatus]|uniref:Uncharacterized protein n=1 Tax=Plakobranchus ocellatus TaxID=259542 RepID=A0AAV4CWA0_9GAST|nr:hypothetical protein PoB_006264000 [Plakobranchus ocellatus]
MIPSFSALFTPRRQWCAQTRTRDSKVPAHLRRGRKPWCYECHRLELRGNSAKACLNLIRCQPNHRTLSRASQGLRCEISSIQ